MYIPLHVHTAKGSVGDSILKINEYIDRGKEYDLTHLAITNHGSMSDMYDFYFQCIENNITPIIGCEVYVSKDRMKKSKDDKYNHLVLIAKNETGLKNLLYITTDAQLNGFYYKPRTDISVLKEHGEGIIALSGCIAGKIPQMLLKLNVEEEIEDAEINKCILEVSKEIELYKEIFDEFYLEIQPGDFQEQEFINESIAYISEITDTPLVATNDVHYLDKDDWFVHDIHVKIARKQKIDDPQIYSDKCYYFQNYQSIISSFKSISEDIVKKAVNNTVAIAQKCNINFDSILHMPKFDVPEGYTEETYLKEISFNRLDRIKNYIADPSQYVSRLMYELDVLSELGFAGYFLTIRDFVQYAKQNNIPIGPGRGSVCGLAKMAHVKLGKLRERVDEAA